MADLVSDREPCTEPEKQELIAYLNAYSHVRLPLDLMSKGWPLEKGKVVGVAKIGQLQTVFKNLGNAHAKDLHGTEFFLVAQALDVFTNPGPKAHPDVPQDMAKIRRYRDLFARKDSKPIVTIVELPRNVLIADGDKTAIAAYLYALETGKPDFILPVYYISPAKA